MAATKVVYPQGKGKSIPSGFQPGEGATVVGQSIYEQSATLRHQLGDRLQIGNRVFYYASAGAALIAGQLCESAAFGGSSATIQTNLTIPATTDGSNAAGQPFVTVTMATDAATLNQFADGYFSVYDGTAGQGVGQTYRIRGNAVASAGGALKLELYDDLVVGITAGSAKGNVIANEFKAIKITAATTSVGFPVGVPLIAVTSGYYAWVQTWGPCCCLISGAGTDQVQLLRGIAAAGAAQVQVAGSSSITNPSIGFLMHLAIADTKYGMVFLQIMP